MNTLDSQAAPASTQTRTILVVDDEPAVRIFLSDILTREGYRVLVAPDGRRACEILNDCADLDLVITDLIMPNQEGIETIRAMRLQAPQLGIIAISGAFGGKFLRMAKGLGADATLTKPVSIQELNRTIEDVLNRA